MSHEWNFPPFLVQVCQVVPMPANHLPVGSTMSTVHLSSDGTYFYWIWSPASLNEKTPKGHSVFMDTFELVVSFTFSSHVFAETFSLAFFLCWCTRDLRNWSTCAVYSLLPQNWFFSWMCFEGFFIWSCMTQVKQAFWRLI